MSIITHLNLNVIIVRPYDDNMFPRYLAVEHNTKNLKAFSIDWNKTIEKVKKKNPETWVLNEVWPIMEKKGWRIISPNTLTVTY